jgi:putative endonuclease
MECGNSTEMDTISNRKALCKQEQQHTLQAKEPIVVTLLNLGWSVVFFTNVFHSKIHKFHVELKNAPLICTMEAYTYILSCADNTFYTGSTKSIKLRLEQHRCGCGANYTKKRLPIELVYLEAYNRIDFAFDREKQIQKWSHNKKKALIESAENRLSELSKKIFDK